MEGDDASNITSLSKPSPDQSPQINVLDENASKLLSNEPKLPTVAGDSHTNQPLDSVTRLGDSSDENGPPLTPDSTTSSGDNVIVGEELQDWMPDIDHESKRVKVRPILFCL
jgi:hypothetical protein